MVSDMLRGFAVGSYSTVLFPSNRLERCSKDRSATPLTLALLLGK
jgi:hypothetical protein